MSHHGLLVALFFVMASSLASGQTYTYTDGENDTSALSPTSSATLTIASGTATQSGPVASPIYDYIYKSGSGEIDLTNTNSIYGVVIDFGTLGVEGPGATLTTQGVYAGDANGDGGAFVVANGAQVSSVDGLTVAGITGSNGAATITGANSSVTATGTFGEALIGEFGSGTLNILNGGQLAVNLSYVGLGSGNFGGSVIVSGQSGGVASTWSTIGEVNIGTFGTGTVTVQNGGIVEAGEGTGTIVLGQYSGSSGSIIIGNGAASGAVEAGQIQGGNGSAQVIFSQTDTATFTPVLTGTLNVLQTGTGTTVLTGANTFTGTTTVSSGVLQFSGAGVLSGAVVMAGSGTLNLNGTSQATTALTGASGTVLNNAAGTTSTLTVSNSGAPDAFSGTLANGKAVLALTNAGTGSLVLKGNNTYTGNTTVLAGTLDLGGGGSTGSISSSSTLVLGGAGTFTYDETGGSQAVNGLSVTSGFATVNSVAYTSTLNLGGITRSAGSILNFGTVNGSITTTTANTNGIIGPWALYDASGILTYAVANGTGGITGLTNPTIVNSPYMSNVTDPTGNYLVGAVATDGGGVMANTLQFGGAMSYWATEGATINGLLNAGSDTLVESGSPIIIGGNRELDIITDNNIILIGSALVDNVAGPSSVAVGGVGTGTVTLSGTNSYTGATYVDTGMLAIGESGSLGSGNYSGPIYDNGTFAFDSSAAQTLSGGISGAGSLYQGGSGTLTLTGANTYTGATTVASGLLILQNSRIISPTATVTIGNTAALLVANGSQITANTLDIGSGTSGTSVVTITGVNASGVASTITSTYLDILDNYAAGTESLIVSNGGQMIDTYGYVGESNASGNTLTVTGVNANGTHSLWNSSVSANLAYGATVIAQNGGVVDVGGGTGTLTVGEGGTLVIGSGAPAGTVLAAAVNGPYALSSVVFSQTNPSYTFAPVLTGAGLAVIQSGPGTTILTGNNSYSGGTTVSGGTLTIASATGLGSGNLTVSNTNTGAGTSVTLNLANTATTTVGSLRGSVDTPSSGTNSATINIASGSNLVVNQTTAGVYAGSITGAGASFTLGSASTATLTLSGANTFSGPTTVAAGGLEFATRSSLYNGSISQWTPTNLTVSAGATVAFGVGGAGQFTASDIATLLNILAGSTATTGLENGSSIGFDATGGNFTLSSAITNSNNGANALGLVKLGSNTLTLAGSNSYTGGTTVVSGALQVSGAGRLGSGNLTSVVGSTVNLNGTNQTVGALIGATSSTLTGSGGAIIGGPVGTTSTLTIGDNNGTGTFSGVLENGSGVLSLIKVGTGTEVFSGTNLYTGGTAINGGTLAVLVSSAINRASVITFGGGTLEYGSENGIANTADYSSQIVNSTGAISINPNGQTVTFNSGLAASNTDGLTMAGTGTLVLNGANAYTGTTAVDMGVLNLYAGSINSASTLSVGGAGTFTYSYLGGRTQAFAGLNVTTGVGTVNNLGAGIVNLGAITRSGGGMLDFGSLSGDVNTTTANTNGIIGPWAFTGTGTSLAYAVSNGPGSPVTSLVGTTATAGTLANVTSASGNYVYSGAATGNSVMANTLKYIGATSTTTLTGQMNVKGLMNSGSGLLTITANASGAVVTTTELDIIGNSAGITISAPIGGPGSLVYGGPLGGTGTLTLSSENTYTGGTVINAGTVAAGVANYALGMHNNLTLAPAGTLDLEGNGVQVNGLNGTGGTITNKGLSSTTGALILGTGTATTADYGGVIQNGTGAVQVQKFGTGTQTLSGANTYTGGTYVSQGALLLQNGSNGSATGSGVLVVTPLGTIGGAGTSKSTSFNISGHIIAGNGTDVTSQTTLMATSDSSIGNAILSFNLGTGAVQGESNTLNLGATPITFSNTTLTLNLVGSGSIQPDTSYTLITTSGPIDPTADGLTIGSNGQITGGLSIANSTFFGTSSNGYSGGFYDGSYLYVSGDDIDVEVVPEPSTWAMLLGGFGLLALAPCAAQCRKPKRELVRGTGFEPVTPTVSV